MRVNFTNSLQALNNSSMSKSQPLGKNSSGILRNTETPEKDTFVSFKASETSDKRVG